MKLENVSSRHILALIHRYIHLCSEVTNMATIQQQWFSDHPTVSGQDGVTLFWLNAGICQNKLGGKTIRGISLPRLSGSVHAHLNCPNTPLLRIAYKEAQRAAYDLCRALGE